MHSKIQLNDHQTCKDTNTYQLIKNKVNIFMILRNEHCAKKKTYDSNEYEVNMNVNELKEYTHT